MTTSDEIVAAAKSLTEEERLHIVELLLQSVYSMDAEVSTAWEEELARRIHAIETGEATWISEENVLGEGSRLLLS
jgi:putative addiction module component (TIGR02574 family)